jgi:hypothetical protein
MREISIHRKRYYLRIDISLGLGSIPIDLYREKIWIKNCSTRLELL